MQSDAISACVTDSWCDVDQLTLDERWYRVESGTRQANASSLAALPQWKLHGSFRAADLHGGGGSTHSFNLVDEELSKFVWTRG